MSEPRLDELPLRAQIGYILKNGEVKHGEMDPSVIVGILHAKNWLGDDRDTEGVEQIVEEVIEYGRWDDE